MWFSFPSEDPTSALPVFTLFLFVHFVSVLFLKSLFGCFVFGLFLRFSVLPRVCVCVLIVQVFPCVPG